MVVCIYMSTLQRASDLPLLPKEKWDPLPLVSECHYSQDIELFLQK